MIRGDEIERGVTRRFSLHSNLPTFLICGGQRCGSTFVWEICRTHPEIFVPLPFKEPKFFNGPSVSLNDYTRIFLEARPTHRAIGEKSVTYMDHPATSYRIRAILPGVKLIFVLRDPVRRAYSHYLYSKQNCLESLDFDQALVWEPYRRRRTPGPLKIAQPWAYVSRGLYASMLAPFFDQFPREQLFVAFFEEMLAKQSAFESSLFRFLGVDPEHRSQVNLPVNQSFLPEKQTEQTIEYLQDVFSGPNLELEHLLGRPVPWTYEEPQLCPSCGKTKCGHQEGRAR